MAWQLWVTLASILALSIAMLCCVALCAMRCFYPAGARDRPANEPERYIMKNGELAWRDAEAPPPRAQLVG